MPDLSNAAKNVAREIGEAMRTEAHTTFFDALKSVFGRPDKFVDEVIGNYYRRFFKEEYKNLYPYLEKVLSPSNMSAVDQKCLDFIALEHAVFASGPIKERDNLDFSHYSETGEKGEKTAKELFQVFCESLKDMVETSVIKDDSEKIIDIDLKKANFWLEDRRWIGRGFFLERIFTNASRLLKAKGISDAFKKLIKEAKANEELNQAFTSTSVEFFEAAKSLFDRSVDKRKKATPLNEINGKRGSWEDLSEEGGEDTDSTQTSSSHSTEVVGKSSVRNLFVGLKLVVGAAWNYLMVSLGWVSDKARDSLKIGKGLMVMGIIISIIAFLLLISTCLGLYLGYFGHPVLGWWLVVISGLFWLMIFLVFKVLEMSIGLAIFTLMFAKAVALDPVLWLAKNGGRRIWEVASWPVVFAYEFLVGTLMAFIATLTGDKEAFSKLGREITPIESEAWENAHKRVEEMMAYARRISLFITIIFKYGTAMVTMLATGILVKAEVFADPEGLAGLFNKPVVALILLILTLLFFANGATNEYQNKKGAVNG